MKKIVNRHRNGRLAEFMARWYFRLRGYQVLYKNYVTGRGTTAGEIDFIARRGTTIVFVEVKERCNLETAAYAIRFHQKQRILNAARFFLQTHRQYKDYKIRFDAVFISLPFKIRCVENAWGE